jgi:hypothetical protein
VKWSAVNPFDPPASRLKPAIQFLRKLDVPASRIARALGETADNIRHIDGRSYEEAPEISLPSRIADSPLLRSSRADLSDKSKNKLEELECQIQQIRKTHGTTDLLSGYQKLRKLLPYVSGARLPGAVMVLSMLEENLAWFSGHLGLAQTAYSYAQKAMDHRRECYRNSPAEREHLISFAGAALIASNALLISNRPLDAISILDLASEANSASGQRLDSEWYRQLGTALLLLGGEDSLSRSLYLKAGQEMEARGGFAHPVSIRMFRDRQENLLDPQSGFEKALTLLEDAKNAFGRFSLEHVMAINWAAAVGLKLDSRSASQHAQELLQELTGQSLPFEHQGTITKLLSVTPKLNLKNESRDRWIRFALYQNAARSK